MTDPIQAELIAKYERLYHQDEKSRIFAPLAETLRKSGDLERAFQIARKGVAMHPNFASGHVVLAKIYLTQENWQWAAESLTKATQLAPENIIAHELLAQLWMKLREPKKALMALKKLLFIRPKDKALEQSVKRLESLTADEYREEDFSFLYSSLFKKNDFPFFVNETDDEIPNAPLQTAAQKYSPRNKAKTKEKSLDRALSLVDALMARNEFSKARELIESTIKTQGPKPDLNTRLALLNEQEQGFMDPSEQAEKLTPLSPRSERVLERKIQLLEFLLTRIRKEKVKRRQQTQERP